MVLSLPGKPRLPDPAVAGYQTRFEIPQPTVAITDISMFPEEKLPFPVCFGSGSGRSGKACVLHAASIDIRSGKDESCRQRAVEGVKMSSVTIRTEIDLYLTKSLHFSFTLSKTV